MIAITISETALTSAARISARRNPKLRFGVAGRRASSTAPAATLSATTSERLWPASASSERLPAKSAAMTSTSVYAALRTSAIISDRSELLVGVDVRPPP